MLLVVLGAAWAVESTHAQGAVEATQEDRWTLLATPASYDTAQQLLGLPVLVEGGTRDELHFEAQGWALPMLDAAGISYRVIEDDIALLRPVPSVGRDVDYRDPLAMPEILRSIALEHPHISRVVQVGTSWEGNPITGLLLTDLPFSREIDEPSLRLLGTHHGDEWSSMEVSLAVAERLTDQYETDEDIRDLIDRHELWVVPVVNPDGADAFTRNNSRDVDLNRNYAYRWEPSFYSGEGPFSEVETAAIRALSMTRAFGHSLSLHSGATNLGWVWNYQLEPAEDEAWMEQLASEYLIATDQPGFWITNGADWYISHGDTNDWSYGTRGGHDYTLEVTLEKTPPADQILDYVGHHLDPTVAFLSGATRAGIRGRVATEDGQGIEASILPLETPWPSWTDPETGAFARPLLPGSYTLEIQAPGFASKTQGVTIGPSGSSESVVELELHLAPLVSMDSLHMTNLEHPTSARGDLQVCAQWVVDTVTGGGQVGLDRPGTGGPYWLDAQAEGSCLQVTIDPERIANPWQREGEWHLVIGQEDGDVVGSRQLAILLTSTAPGYTLDGVEVQAADDLGHSVVHILGDNLAEGSMVRLVGPRGQRVFPERILSDDGPARLATRVDGAALEDGTWSLRVFGNGHWTALTGALEVHDGLISQAQKPTEGPTTERPETEGWTHADPSPLDIGGGDPPGDDDSDEAPPISGCSCTVHHPESRAGNLWLALLLGIRYSRVRFRRRNACMSSDAN